METSLAASGTGKGGSSTARTRLKIAVLTPIPSASESTPSAVKPGFFRSSRAANRRSCQSTRTR